MDKLDLDKIRNWMNEARPTPFNFAQFSLQARTHIAGLIAEVRRLQSPQAPAAPVQAGEREALETWKRSIQAGRNAGATHWEIPDIISRIDEILAQDKQAPKEDGR